MMTEFDFNENMSKLIYKGEDYELVENNQKQYIFFDCFFWAFNLYFYVM